MSAVAAPVDGDPCRIGHAHGDHTVDPGHEVDQYAARQIPSSRRGKTLAVAGAAAGVGRQHGVALGGEELVGLRLIEDVTHAVRAVATQVHQQRVALILLVFGGIDQQPLEGQAIGGRPTDSLLSP